MIFVNGYVHCDPHPGNILVRRSPKRGVEIVFLDHGLYQVSPLIPLLHPKCPSHSIARGKAHNLFGVSKGED